MNYGKYPKEALAIPPHATLILTCVYIVTPNSMNALAMKKIRCGNTKRILARKCFAAKER